MHQHGIAAADVGVALGIRVIQVQHAALADHGVVVEVLLESLPELHGPFVERVVARQKIIRADDGGIAAGITGTYPAFLEHSHVRYTVDLRKIVGRRQPMATAADDDDVVRRLRRRVTPGGPPTTVTVKRLSHEIEELIANLLSSRVGARSGAYCR